MIKKIIVGGVVGGIVLFIWGALAWTVLPLHSGGIKKLPNEDAVIDVVRANVTEAGFYTFPCPGITSDMTKEQKQDAMKAAEEKFQQGPIGILVVRPKGRAMMPPKMLVKSLVIQIVSALVASFLLMKASPGLPGYGDRVQFATFLGFFASVVVDLQYWNWFAFTTSYTLAAVADHVIGWFLCGLVLAAIVKPTPTVPATP